MYDYWILRHKNNRYNAYTVMGDKDFTRLTIELFDTFDEYNIESYTSIDPWMYADADAKNRQYEPVIKYCKQIGETKTHSGKSLYWLYAPEEFIIDAQAKYDIVNKKQQEQIDEFYRVQHWH